MRILDVLIWISLIPLAPVVVTWWLPWERWLPNKIPKFVLGPYLLYAAFALWHFKFTWWVVLVGAIYGAVLSVMAVFEKESEIRRPSWVSLMFRNGEVFAFSSGVSVDVVDVEAARRWYSEKLGLGYSSTKVEIASVVLGYSADDPQVYLCKIVGNERPQPGRPPILFAKKVESAHEFLSSRGVDVGPLQSDSGGNRFFRFRDLEGNEVEVCQES